LSDEARFVRLRFEGSKGGNAPKNRAAAGTVSRWGCIEEKQLGFKTRMKDQGPNSSGIRRIDCELLFLKFPRNCKKIRGICRQSKSDEKKIDERVEDGSRRPLF